MQCISPITIPIKDGFKIVDWREVPCMSCEACQENFKDSWAFRNLLELQCHDKVCMITLTFSDDGLARHNAEYPDIPLDSVCKREFDLFMKRLRKSLDVKIRFFGVSEYGKKSTERPHYHIILYGIDEHHSIFNGKIPVYDKGMIKHYYIYNGISSWNYGQVEVSSGRITADAIRYMLKYVLKQRQDKPTRGRLPMFHKESRRPGIGALGVKKFFKTLFNNGYGQLGSRKIALDRYVVSKMEEMTNIDVKDDIAYRRRLYLQMHQRKKIDKKQWLINFKKGKR